MIFTYQKKEFSKYFPDLKGEMNVFSANVDGTNLTPVTNGLEGYNVLVAVSPDGTKTLVASSSKQGAKTSNLYIINLISIDTQPVKLAEGLPNGVFGNNSAAKWIDNSNIVYIGQGKNGFGIYKTNIDGSDPIKIEGNTPYDILAVSSTRVYWEIQTDRVQNGNQHFLSYRVWWTSLDGTERNQFKFHGKQVTLSNFLGKYIAFSPDGTRVAWVDAASPEKGPPYYNYLHIATLPDLKDTLTFETLTGDLDLRWFPDGEHILVFDLFSTRNSLDTLHDYANKDPKNPWPGKSFFLGLDTFGYLSKIYGLYTVGLAPNPSITNYNLPNSALGSFRTGLLHVYSVSPDGRLVVCSQPGTGNSSTGDSTDNFSILNVETSKISTVSAFNFLGNYSSQRRIEWIP